jgi:hypothetical protein
MIEASRESDDGHEHEIVWIQPQLIIRESSLASVRTFEA